MSVTAESGCGESTVVLCEEELRVIGPHRTHQYDTAIAGNLMENKAGVVSEPESDLILSLLQPSARKERKIMMMSSYTGYCSLSVEL